MYHIYFIYFISVDIGGVYGHYVFFFIIDICRSICCAFDIFLIVNFGKFVNFLFLFFYICIIWQKYFKFQFNLFKFYNNKNYI